MLNGINLKKRKIRISRLGFIFIVFISIAEIYEVGYFNMYYLTCPLISLFWGAFGFVAYMTKIDRSSIRTSAVIDGMKLLLFPWIIFLVQNVIIFVSGNGNRAFLKSSFVQITFAPLFIIGACGMYYLMGKNSIRYIIYSIYINYIFIIYAGFRKYGFIGFFRGIVTVFQGNSVYNPFEQNGDVLFTLGILLIFYYESLRVKDKSDVGNIIMLITFVIFGGKKIEYLSLILIGILLFVIKKVNNKKDLKRIIYIVAGISVILLLIYVSFVVSGALGIWTNSHGINTMNRIKWYSLVSGYAEMSPVFLGKGYSFCNLTLETLGYNVALHSDILKIYIEMGFLVFIFWVLYNLAYVPYKILKKFGVRASRFFWITTLYLFMNYVTDNSTIYFTVQTVYTLLTIYLIEKAKGTEDMKTKHLLGNLKGKELESVNV